MREFKFRFWDENMRDYWDWEEIQDDWESEGYYDTAFRQDHWKCEQYIELRDIHGKEIYENDIVKQHDNLNNKDYIGVVEFHASEYVLVYPDGTGGHCVRNIQLGFNEVLGNCNENPELIPH